MNDANDQQQTATPITRDAQQAIAALQSGGLVGLATETVYGLAACASHDDAFARLQSFKGYSAQEPAAFSLHVASAEAALALLGDGQANAVAAARRLIRRTMPGPMTLLLEVDDALRAGIAQRAGWSDEVSRRLMPRGVLGLRCPDHPLAQQVLSQVREPVVASGAHAPGARVPHTAREAAQATEGVAAVVLDGGRCRFGKPSSVVRVSGGTVEMIREGVFDERWVRKAMTRTALFVCTGNTCRSPMAEAMARKWAAKKLGVSPDALAEAGVVVRSAGAYAGPGMPASAEAVTAAAKLDADVSSHRSSPLSQEMLREADRIWCMTASHREAVLQIAPWAESKVELLDPDGGDVTDPFGGSQEVYERCAKQIDGLVRQRVDEWISG